MDLNPEQGQQREIYRLVRENNKMLHSMRRNAFWGGVIKFLLYAILLVALPWWLYLTYLAPMVESTMQAVNQIQGTGASVQTQFGDFQDFFKQLQSKLSPTQQ